MVNGAKTFLKKFSNFHLTLFWWHQGPWLFPENLIKSSGQTKTIVEKMFCYLALGKIGGPSKALFQKKNPDPDGLIIITTKMTNTGHFLWNGSSKIQIFTDIWYPAFCRRLLWPAYVIFYLNWLVKLKFHNLRNIQIPSNQK